MADGEIHPKISDIPFIIIKGKSNKIRELFEEFKVVVKENDLEEFGTFKAQAAGNESRMVSMHCFIVKSWDNTPAPNNEVEQIRWITSDIPKDIRVGSIFEHEVIPKLKDLGLID